MKHQAEVTSTGRVAGGVVRRIVAWVVVVGLGLPGLAAGGGPEERAAPVAAAAADAGAGLPRPRMRVDEPVFDFGRVAGGAVLKHSFTFVNAGEGTLRLKQVKSSCGCAVSQGWSEAVEPGQSGSIPVEVLTATLTGEVNKPLTVLCNDPEQPEVTLKIRGTVWHPLELLPPSVVLHFVADSDVGATGRMRIINHTAEPLELGAPESNQRGLTAVLKTNRPGAEYELEVRTVPPLGAGNLFGQMAMMTSATNRPVLTVPVYALARPAVTVVPPSLLLPAGPLSSNFTCSVTIRSAWTEELVVSEPEFPDATVGLRVERLEPEIYAVELKFPAGFRLASDVRSELRLKTNHPRFASIRVPVRQAGVGAVSRARAGSPAPVQP